VRNDLLKAIARSKDLSNVIVLTYNVDLIFVEAVFLRNLRRCGYPSLTVLADAEEVTKTFDAQARWLSAIGRRFRVVPVPMPRGFRFHPKAVLLSGPAGGELFVGSGNLTFGGLRQNEELWTSFSTDEDGTGPFAAFRELLHACLSRCPAGSRVRREVDEAYSAATRKWAEDLGPSEGLIWRMGEGPPLLDQIRAVAGNVTFDRIVVCAPYFDDQGAGLRGFAERWPGAQIEILVQPGHSQLTRGILKAAKTSCRLFTTVSAREGTRQPFLHGKFYAFISGKDVLLFAGSANCSAAALTTGRGSGNAEALAVRRMSEREFREQVLAELEVVDEEPALSKSVKNKEPDTSSISIEILSSSYEGNSLRVLFRADSGIRIGSCWTDEREVTLGPGTLCETEIILPLSYVPASIRLGGSVEGRAVWSRRHWVDHEFVLNSTSRHRKLAQAIESGVSPTTWSFGSWVEVMRLLGDHLKYNPEIPHPGAPTKKRDNATSRSYSGDDFFTDDYRLPSQRRETAFVEGDERIMGLQHLLLEYFGSETGEAPLPDEDGEQAGEEETVDRPEDPRRRRSPVKRDRRERQPISDAERRRARRIARKVVDQVLDKRFLRYRHQDLLANDLTIVAVLLVAGYSEGWLPPEEFSQLTHSVWTALFFDHGQLASSKSPPKGWLQCRLEEADDAAAFVESVGTVPVSAAMAMWSFTCPQATSGAETARFALANRLAVARLPWLWNLSRLDEVAFELGRIASRTGWMDEGAERRWGNLVGQWNQLLGEGRALFRLEEVLRTRTLSEWAKMVRVDRVEKGTLLWQGGLGFAVATQQVMRRPGSVGGSVGVLLLRAEKQEAQISLSYLLPVKALVDTVAKAGGASFTRADVGVLKPFVASMEKWVVGKR
jgi:hypothetical protein